MFGAFSFIFDQVKRIIFTVTNDLVFDQRMQRICSTLADVGYSVTLVGRKHDDSPPLSKNNFEQKRLKCLNKKGKGFYAEFNIRLFLYLLFKKCNCICAIDLDTILPCYYISKIRKIRRVYDAHEYFSQLDEVVSRPKIYRFWKKLESKMLPLFKNGYTVCESLAAEFKKQYGVTYEVIRNMPLYRDINKQKVNDRVVLYQGAVNKGRGLDKLVMAMKDIDAVLWVAGNGNFMEEIKRVVEKEKLTGKIIFWGMLNPTELRSKTAQAYIAINPFEKKGLNQYLSLSNKFFDYIHAGIPQVTMNYPEYKRVNDKYNIAVLIDDITPSQISGAINKLFADQNLYDRLSDNCKIASKELNWENEKPKLLNFYSQLFNE